MKYALRGINAEELKFVKNNVQVAPNTRIGIKQSCNFGTIKENDKLQAVVLEARVDSTEEAPSPFNMVARVVGVFEVEDVVTEEDKQILAVSMVELVYPYLRNVVSSLTFSAFIPPIVLPVRFPEQLIPGFQSGAAFETPEVLN